MNGDMLRQIKEQISLQVGEQVGQIKLKLIESLHKMGGHGNVDVSQVSRKTWIKIAMGAIFQNTEDIFDYNGHLVNMEDWSKEVAEYLAMEEGVPMTDAHWEVINLIREYYEEYKFSPIGNMLVKIIRKKFGPEKGNRKYLYELFPAGPARQAIKIAGLPRPTGTV